MKCSRDSLREEEIALGEVCEDLFEEFGEVDCAGCCCWFYEIGHGFVCCVQTLRIVRKLGGYVFEMFECSNELASRDLAMQKCLTWIGRCRQESRQTQQCVRENGWTWESSYTKKNKKMGRKTNQTSPREQIASTEALSESYQQ